MDNMNNTDKENIKKVKDLCIRRLNKNKTICIVNIFSDEFPTLLIRLVYGALTFPLFNIIFGKGRLNFAAFLLGIVFCSIVFCIIKASIEIKRYKLFLTTILSQLEKLDYFISQHGFDENAKEDFKVIEELLKENI